ncbi:MAG: inositol monophosphatase [Muribaculaceae bacterium]|nr:inositol monophosphatase [Muribaculaceae bacterium]
MDDILISAISWARQAGAVQMRYFRSPELVINTKFNVNDVVTQADKESEALLIRQINDTFPDHAILSEESGDHGKNAAEYRWIIDPLDGTANFSSGLPMFCVSIAVERNGEIIIGVVHAPYLGETFHAVKGMGAYLNGNPIHCRATASLDKAVVSTGFPVDRNVNPDNNLDNVARVLPLVRGLRRLGSAALDMSYVAAGYLDAYWEMDLHQWDVAAGELIATEAGAVCRSFRDNRNYSVMVATPQIEKELFKHLV